MKPERNPALANLTVTCITVTFANLYIMYADLAGTRYVERGIHILLTMAIGLLAYNKKIPTTRHSIMLYFIAVVTPFYLHVWNYHQDAVESGHIWIPLFSLHIYAIFISLIYTGSYLLNAAFLSGFIIEAILLNQSLRFAHLENATFIDEPEKSILFFGVSGILLFFRTKNEDANQELMITEVREEELKRRLLLIQSIRERTQPPLLSLKTGLEVMKQKYPQEQQTINGLEHAVEKINSLNTLLNSSQSDEEKQ